MVEANVSTTVPPTVPQDNSGPDLGGVIAILVLLLIGICSCVAVYSHYRIRRWNENRQKYKEYYNNNARDDDTPDDRDYRRNDRRGAQRQTRSFRDRDGIVNNHYYDTPPPDTHRNAPRGQGKDRASEKHTQTQAHSEEHDTAGHQTKPSTHSEEQGRPTQAPAQYDDQAHSVRSDGRSSSSRVIYSTPPVEVHHSHIPSFASNNHSFSAPHSSSSSRASTIWAQPNHFGHPVPTLPHVTPTFGGHLPQFPHPTLPHVTPTFGGHLPQFPHPTLPHFSTLPHPPQAPHAFGGHPFPHRLFSKIGTEDPDDSP